MDCKKKDGFRIDNDKLADWALVKIQEEETERDRLIAIAEDRIVALQEQIEDLKRVYDNKTSFLKSCLAEYFTKVPHKETKTQESYKLLSGSLVMKKPTTKIIHDEDKLMAYLEANKEFDYIKIKKSPDWAEFKKKLIISDGEVINSETGEVIEACSVEDVPASFDIKY